VSAAGSDKAARFLQLCDAFGLPIVSLVDTPGYMVGPNAETEALVRRSCRLLVAGAALRVPLVAVILRRAHGLGAGDGGGSLEQEREQRVRELTAALHENAKALNAA
jgi:methylmalonyl-CoA carboxyltransferase 12S subunit